MTPRLSVCLIVRDEALRLARALDSVKEIADELVVVDTGSSDTTREIARSFEATVELFPWRDDFAAARNASFSAARGDWVLIMDADERLTLDSWPELVGCLSVAKVAGFMVIIADDPEPGQPQVPIESWRLRLFRRSLAPPMVGRIHERFEPPLWNFGPVRHTAIRLSHDGYASGSRLAKLRRALPLLKLEILERPERYDILVELARTALALGDSDDPAAFSRATDVLLARAADPVPPHPHAAIVLERHLALPDGHPRASELAARWFPNAPPIRLALARRAFTRSEFLTARDHLDAVLRLGREGTYDRSIPFSPSVFGDETWMNFAACEVRLGRIAEARAIFRRLAESARFGEAARANLQTLAAFD